MVTVGFMLVVLVQRVCGWAVLGISLLWLLMLLVASRLAQTNVPPGFTLMLDVRDAALPNKLRAATVTWLPVMSDGVAADVLCAVS